MIFESGITPKSIRIIIQRRIASIALDIHGLQYFRLPFAHFVSFFLLHLPWPSPKNWYSPVATQYTREKYRDGDGVVHKQRQHELDKISQQEFERSLVFELDLVQLIVSDALRDLLGVASLARIFDARP